MKHCKSSNVSGVSILPSGISRPSNFSMSYARVTHCAWSMTSQRAASFASGYVLRIGRWPRGACRAPRHDTEDRAPGRRDADGGLDQASRARQQGTAAPHGVSLAANGQDVEPNPPLWDRNLLFFVRTDRTASLAALFAPRAGPAGARTRPICANLELRDHHSRSCLFDQRPVRAIQHHPRGRGVAACATLERPRCLVDGRAHGQLRSDAQPWAAPTRAQGHHGHVRGKCAQDQCHARGHQSAPGIRYRLPGTNRRHAQHCRAHRPRRICRRVGRPHAGGRGGPASDAAGRARVLAHRSHARGGDPALPGVLHGRAVSGQERLPRAVRASRRFFRDARRRPH